MPIADTHVKRHLQRHDAQRYPKSRVDAAWHAFLNDQADDKLLAPGRPS